jgi:hypothetical protein
MEVFVMAGLMDMRELGMLRNAAQRMERGGGIDMDEWRRRKAAEEQSVAEQAIAATRAHPAYQALKSGASGGPFAAGAIVRSLPFLRAGPAAVDMAKAAGRGASTAGKYLKGKLWSPGYTGASRKGEMVFGRDSSGKLVPRIASKAGEWKYSSRPTKWGATVGEAATLGAAGAAYLASRDDEPELEETVAPTAESVTYPEVEYGEVTPLPGGYYTGDPMEDNPSSLKTIIDSPKREKEPLPAPQKPQNEPVETPENTPNLWKTWGSLADDPKKRRDAYLGSLKNIYMKKMLLDSIAKLTGGKSQGRAWAEMAIAELDAIEKFDSEERIHQQWKALFFREDGTYDPPKDRKEAMERGQQLGYDADQMKDIMTVFPKETDDRPTLQKNISFILAMEDGPMKRSLMKEHGLIETDDLTAAERSADRAVRDGIITEEEKEAYIRSIFVPKDTSRTKGGVTTEQFNIWLAMPEGTEEEIELKRVYRNMISADRGRITAGQAADLLTASAEGRLTLSAVEQTALKKIFDAGLGVKTPTVSAKDRAQQLKAEGKTKEQAKEIMREEDYDID